MEHHLSHPSDSAAAEQTRQPDRNAARPLPPRPRTPRTESTERKRQQQGRTHPRNMAAGGRYHYLGDREDLAARVLPQFRPQQSTPTMSEIAPNIPQWQSDEEVQKCPVCQQEFTLFFRKHHCRKCGKVVCGDCSRHRITVPLRYIAQPPWAIETALQYAGTASPVRVCNPCVPDPWSPPENAAETRPRPGTNRYSLPPPPTPLIAQAGRVHRHSTDLSRPPPYDYTQIASRTAMQPGQITYRRTPMLHSNSSPVRGRALDQHSRIRFADTPSLPVRTPAAPRREVKEEDECPVCGIELEPGDATREVHISSCISTRFGSVDSARSPNVPTPDHTEASSSDPMAATRARAQSYRSRGLYQYRATEKDCIDGEGEEQECPICFEEFQPGETLGRLECLCRFHHKCIREWWVRKGPGMCPVHASHE